MSKPTAQDGRWSPPPLPAVHAADQQSKTSRRKHSAKRTQALYENAAAKKERVKTLRKTLYAECTFRPKLSSSRRRGGTTAEKEAENRPQTAQARLERLYRSGVETRRARREQAQPLDKECTFRPVCGSRKKGAKQEAGAKDDKNTSSDAPSAQTKGKGKGNGEEGESAVNACFERLYKSGRPRAARPSADASPAQRDARPNGSDGTGSSATLHARKSLNKLQESALLGRLYNPAQRAARLERLEKMKEDKFKRQCSFMPQVHGDATAPPAPPKAHNTRDTDSNTTTVDSTRRSPTAIDRQGTFRRLYEDAALSRARREEAQIKQEVLDTQVNTFQPNLSYSFAHKDRQDRALALREKAEAKRGGMAKDTGIDAADGADEYDKLFPDLISDEDEADSGKVLGERHADPYERLFHAAGNQRERLAEEKERHTAAECPFVPQISESSRSLVAATRDRELASLDAHERLYKVGTDQQKRVRRQAEAARRLKERKEMAQCTFKPNISPAKEPHTIPNVIEHAYDATTEVEAPSNGSRVQHDSVDTCNLQLAEHQQDGQDIITH